MSCHNNLKNSTNINRCNLDYSFSNISVRRRDENLIVSRKYCHDLRKNIFKILLIGFLIDFELNGFFFIMWMFALGQKLLKYQIYAKKKNFIYLRKSLILWVRRINKKDDQCGHKNINNDRTMTQAVI